MIGIIRDHFAECDVPVLLPSAQGEVNFSSAPYRSSCVKVFYLIGSRYDGEVPREGYVLRYITMNPGLVKRKGDSSMKLTSSAFKTGG
jgi:hypothetical protein